MSDATLILPGIRTQPTSVTRKMAAALPGLREIATQKGLKIHHLGAGYPHPEVTNPRLFIERTDRWFAHLAKQEGLNDPKELPTFLRDAYAYTDTMGPVGPRESFARVYGNDWGVQIDPAHLIPTIGATGGIALLCSVFERMGTEIAYITDAPTYAGFLARATLNQQASIYSIPMDREGADPDALRDQIRNARADGKLVPFYYTVPDGHNPAGFSFSMERRQELLRVAEEENILIAEDAPYLYINYNTDRKANRPFVSLNPERSVHLFTGSKIGLPGPRVGFVYSDATVSVDNGSEIALTELLLSESSSAILFHNPLSLLTFEALLRNNDGAVRESLWPLAEEKLEIYRENREIVLGGLEEGLGPYRDYFDWTLPDAGFFCAFSINQKSLRVDDVFTNGLVEKYGVVVVPMYGFYPDDFLERSPNAGYDQLRLSFCFTESAGDDRRRDLREAVSAFCHAMKKECGLM